MSIPAGGVPLEYVDGAWRPVAPPPPPSFIDTYFKGFFVGHLVPGLLFVLWSHTWMLAYLAHRIYRRPDPPERAGRKAWSGSGRRPAADDAARGGAQGGTRFETRAHYYGVEVR